MKKLVTLCLLGIALLLVSCDNGTTEELENAYNEKVVVGYITSWNSTFPDPKYVTHLNYAFGHVTNTFDGVRIDNVNRLKRVVALKKQNPKLKVLLSVGGWGSGGFSEMVSDEKKRKSFAKSCLKAIKEYGLDGIDIDWEYPSSSVAGISSSPNDTENFTLLMQDLRKTIGNDRLLTLATICTAKFIHFRNILNYIDFVNIMAYDMADPPKHHAALYRTELSNKYTSESSVNSHLAAGIPPEKLVMGMPFYGQGTMKMPRPINIEKTKADSCLTEHWDEKGMFPYLTDKDGKVVYTFENPRSIAAKCQFIKSKNLRGAMYWECGLDNAQLDLSRTVYEEILK